MEHGGRWGRVWFVGMGLWGVAGAADVDADGVDDAIDACPTVPSHDVARFAANRACVAGAAASSGATIGAAAQVGAVSPEVQAMPTSVAGANIGARATIEHGAIVESGVSVGRRATVGANTWIGADSFLAADTFIGHSVGNPGGGSIESLTLGYGSYVEHDAAIGDGVVIGNLVTLGEGAEIGADSKVGRGARLDAGARVGEGARVGAAAWLGADAFLDDYVTLGAGATVGAGAQIGAGVTLRRGAEVFEGAVVPDDAVVRPGRSFPLAQLLAASAPTGGVVRLTSLPDGRVRDEFHPYDAGYTGSVNIAVGDVTGDGVDDLLTVAGSTPTGHVKVFDGMVGREIRSFFAFPEATSGAPTIAVGDVTGDGVDDVIVGSTTGASRIKVFDGNTGNDLRDFFAFDAGYAGGINIAAGDVTGDGVEDIVVGAASGSSRIKVFDGVTGAGVRDFFAFDAGYAGGVNVASGDLDGDGSADVIVGAAVGAPAVKLFSGATGAVLQSHLLGGGSSGVRVGRGPVDNTGRIAFFTSSGTDVGYNKVEHWGDPHENLNGLALQGSFDVGTASPTMLPGSTPGLLFAGAGQVRGFDAAMALVMSFSPTPAGSGRIQIAAGDVNGDGTWDIALTNPPGTTSRIWVFDGRTGALRNTFTPLGETYTAGINIAAGDVNGDGLAEFSIGEKGDIKTIVMDARTGRNIRSFETSQGYPGGSVIHVPGPDMEPDFPDLLLGPDSGTGPVRALNSAGVEVASFFPFGAAYAGGVVISSGDLDGDGTTESVFVGTATGSCQVKRFTYSGGTFTETGSFFAFNPGTPEYTGGVGLVASQTMGDGVPEIVVTSATQPGPARMFSPGGALLATLDVGIGSGPTWPSKWEVSELDAGKSQ
jgi:NDP-sugar pyrophosphorylase family protein